MKFNCQLVKKNFEQHILPHLFECNLLHGSPFHMEANGKTFYLDAKHIKFLDSVLVMEGIIADEKNVYGRCLIEFKNGQ